MLRPGPSHRKAAPAVVPVAAVAALLAGSLAAGSAQALTPEEVWEAWQEWYAVGGSSITATATERDGATLMARGVTVSSEADDLSVAMTVGDVAFTESGDGTVAVALPDSYDLVLSGEAGERLVLTIRHPGMQMSVAEGETGLVHTQSAPEFSLSLTEISGPDAPEIPEASIAVQRMGLVWEIPADPGGASFSDLTSAALSATLRLRDGDDRVDLDYTATGLRMRFDGAGLDQMEALVEDDDFAAALAEGLSISVATGYDTQRYRFDIDAEGEEALITGTAMDGDSGFAIGPEGLSLRSDSRNAEVTVQGSEMPFPQLTLRAAQLAYGLALPVSGAEAPQGVSLLVRLVDAVLPEDLWAMADPSGALPRGPVTAVIDLVGEAVLPADLFSMDTMFGYMMGGPFAAAQPEALELRELRLAAAGAELTGEGAFTFDMTDLETFDGVPRPTGVLNLALTGGNALLDTLVSVGLVAEEDAMGARMVLALFARQGEGADQLVSTIELREDGAVFANGMRLQ